LPDSWISTDLADESRKLFYEAAIARQSEIEKSAKAVRLHGLIFGSGCLVVAAVAIASAAGVYFKTPVPNPMGYALIDTTSGAIVRPVPAQDAPNLFTESVRLRGIRDFIVACESYVPQTWATLDWHSCMIHSTPDEQKRRDADIGQFGARYPRTVFGPTGWAMPTQFLAFVKLGEVGTATNRTYQYQVRYERTEVVNGRESHPHYTANVTFQFHPELKETDADRLLNETGYQATSFSTVKD
jgi:VirB8 protein